MAVYIWHCDRAGDYSLYSRDAAEQNYLRGVQVADQDGRVSFTSIFPACYDGRWPHIHFEVFDSLEAAVAGENARLTSQIALPEQACTAVFGYDTGYAASVPNMSRVTLSSDNVFGDGWDAELATVTGDPASGMTIALTIGVGEKSTSTPERRPRRPAAERRPRRPAAERSPARSALSVKSAARLTTSADDGDAAVVSQLLDFIEPGARVRAAAAHCPGLLPDRPSG